MEDPLCELIRGLEEALHKPEVRKDAAQVSQLLHSGFLEIGRSGRRFDKSSILEELRAEEPTLGIRSSGYEVELITPGVALLTYESWRLDRSGGRIRETLRSSLWIETPDGWRLRFHQGTPKS